MAGAGTCAHADQTVHVGRFALGSLLGEGGLSTVFASVDPLDQRPVAVKVMRPELVDVPGAQLRFLREFELLQQIESSHVVKAHEYYQADDGRSVIVLERAIESVSDRMGRDKIGGVERLQASVRVADHLGAALSVVHRKHLVFGDVGPRNLLIVDGGPLLKGSAAATDPAGLLGDHERFVIADPSLELAAEETGTGPWQEFGTPRFSAPEQSAGVRPLTAAADIYAATAALWYVLFGRPPHRMSSETVSYMAPSVRSFFETGMHEIPLSRFEDIDAWHAGAHMMFEGVTTHAY